ncbi:MAG: signal peptidase II, partial [Terrimicrobiaceae bacterium]
MKSALRWLLLLAFPLYLADQVTKRLVIQNIGTGDAVQILPGVLDFVHVHNTGAAFGMLKDNNLFFVLLAVAALLAV